MWGDSHGATTEALGEAGHSSAPAEVSGSSDSSPEGPVRSVFPMDQVNKPEEEVPSQPGFPTGSRMSDSVFKHYYPLESER